MNPDGTPAASGTPIQQTPPVTTPQDTGIAAALQNLPPEYAFLGPLFQQQQAQIQNAISSNKTEAQKQMDNLDLSYKSIADTIQQSKDDYTTTADAIKGMLDEVKKDSEQNVSNQETSAQNKLQWTLDQNLRADAKAKVDQHNSMVAQIALSGGFGQDAGLREVATSDATFDQKMSDLRTTFGYDSTDLSAKFTSMQVAARKDYADKSIANMKDLQSHLETLSTQGNQNTVAWTTAQNNLLKDSWNTQVGLRKDLASSNLDMGKTIGTMVENRQKAIAEAAKAKETNRIKEEAIAAASGTRADARATAAGVHNDALSQQSAQGISTQLQAIRGKLQTASQPYDVYINAQQFKSSFDDAYSLFTAKDATEGDRATADAQMAFQFSHFQNIGSLRIQEVAGDAAKGNQSAAAKFSANINAWLNGGSALDPTVRTAMKTLIENHTADLQKAATSSILTAWSDARSANRNFPNAPSPITPDQLTSDPALLNAMYQGQDKSAGDFWDSGGSASSQSSSAPTGAFSPSAQMKGGVSTTIGTRTVSGTPQMLTALQSADAAMFKATGQHLQINSDFRTGAQQQQAYNDYLSGKIARAAPPGSSLHEKGLAADVTNWKEAEPYLVAAGLSPLGPIGSKIRSEDPAHFQLGDSYSGNVAYSNNSPDAQL